MSRRRDPNGIRGWLGHAPLNPTNRYAKITMRMKTEAMKLVRTDRLAQLDSWQSAMARRCLTAELVNQSVMNTHRLRLRSVAAFGAGGFPVAHAGQS